MDNILGLGCKLYRNNGTFEVPDWLEIDNVTDLTMPLTKAEANATTRGNKGFRATVGTIIETGLEFQMFKRAGDTHLTALRQAFLARTPVEFACLDGPLDEASSWGLRFTCEVMDCSRDEELESPVTYNVAIKPTLATNPPQEIVGQAA